MSNLTADSRELHTRFVNNLKFELPRSETESSEITRWMAVIGIGSTNRNLGEEAGSNLPDKTAISAQSTGSSQARTL